LGYVKVVRRRLIKRSHYWKNRVAATNQINRRRREKAMAIKKAKCGKKRAKKVFTISCLHEKGSMVTFAQF
jgi:hypothetical protein